jgi:hypothetical protein
MKRMILLVLVLVAALTSVASAAAPTKSAYIARADGICARGDQKLHPLQVKIKTLVKGAASNLFPTLDVYYQETSINLAMCRQLIAVPQPPADRATLHLVWGAKLAEQLDLRKFIRAARTLKKDGLSKTGEQLVLKLEGAWQSEGRAYHSQAVQFGLKVCGS